MLSYQAKGFPGLPCVNHKCLAICVLWDGNCNLLTGQNLNQTDPPLTIPLFIP